MTPEARKFWKDCYIAAMAELVKAHDWKLNGELANSSVSRSEIAKNFADEAVRNLGRLK